MPTCPPGNANGPFGAGKDVCFEQRRIGGITVSAGTAEDVCRFLLHRLHECRTTYVAFANTNLIVQLDHHAPCKNWLENFLVLNDGVGLDLASSYLYGSPFPNNLVGTDFTPKLLEKLPARCRVFLYGARPQVVEKTKQIIDERFKCSVVGFRDGYLYSPSAVAEEIRLLKADVVLVALGNPVQEQWIAEYGAKTGAKLLLAVGALFDFMSASVPRAPVALRRLRLEWLYRLAREPHRLGKRYTIDVIRFAGIIHRQKRSMKLGAPSG
jgi:bacterial polymer biosynthesis proteins, WecB/TagA/CpsF family